MNEQQQDSPAADAASTRPKSERIWLGVVAALFVVVGLLGYALYQKSQNYSQLEAELSQQSKKADDKMEVEKIEAVDTNGIESQQTRTEQQTTDEEIFIGTAGQDITSERALIDIIYDRDTNFKSFHLEYGTAFDDLASETEPDSSEIGLGDDSQQVGDYSVSIDGDGLESGRRYFYRIVGVTDSDDTAKSDIAAFDNDK